MSSCYYCLDVKVIRGKNPYLVNKRQSKVILFYHQNVKRQDCISWETPQNLECDYEADTDVYLAVDPKQKRSAQFESHKASGKQQKKWPPLPVCFLTRCRTQRCAGSATKKPLFSTALSE